jgi:hypothetical protein
MSDFAGSLPRERLQYFAGRIARTALAYLEAGVVPWG